MDQIGGDPDSLEAAARPHPGRALRHDSRFRSGKRNSLGALPHEALVLVVSQSSDTRLSSWGREVVLGPGDAVLISGASLAVLPVSSHARLTAIVLPPWIGGLMGDIEAAIMRPIARQSAALPLLRSYLDTVARYGVGAAPRLGRMVAGHIHELMMLATGVVAEAQSGPRRLDGFARLHAIKADIASNLHRSDLSVGSVADRHRVTTRYVQRLFKGEGTTFSDFVAAGRLDLARGMLGDAAITGHTISAVAFACGFGDLSNFNRRFRRRFGTSLSAILRASRNS